MAGPRWIVNVCSYVAGRDSTGTTVCLSPGRYVMAGTSEITYEIRNGTVAAMFTVSEVAQYRRTGALRIDGRWP